MALRTTADALYGTPSGKRRRRRSRDDERPTLTLRERDLDAALRREGEALGLRFKIVEEPFPEDGRRGERYARAPLAPGRVAGPENLARFLLRLEAAGIAYALRCTAPHRFGGKPRRLFEDVVSALDRSSRAAKHPDFAGGEETTAA